MHPRNIARSALTGLSIVTVLLFIGLATPVAANPASHEGASQSSRNNSNGGETDLSGDQETLPAYTGGLPLRRIVVFDESIHISGQLDVVRRAGGVHLQHLRIINAVAAVLPDAASERALAARGDVLRIDEDLEVHAHSGTEIPWGVARVAAPDVWGDSTGAGVKVGIVDSGIQKDHPDLLVAGGYLALTNPPYHRKSRDEWNDDNGHGTHVAGTVAAFGAIGGVAPEAALYAVKVLDKNGSGSFSSVIAGIEWCIANGMQVVNMSLGASSGNDSLHDAIQAADAAGLILVASAGNSGPGDNTIGYPAAYPETIAVAASDSNNTIASWSSRGGAKGAIDLAAPGVGIKSTWIDSGYRTISGTSMAAPHVAGVAALVIAHYGKPSPEEMWALLTSTAEDLAHEPKAQGSGLVRADGALGVKVEPKPAFFAVSNLNPATITVEPNTEFTVTANVTNTGDEAATQTVVFQIGDDGATEQTESVTLAAGASQSVSFTAAAPAAEGIFAYTISTQNDVATGTLTVQVVEPVEGGVAIVQSVSYSIWGGPGGNRHLGVTIAIVDGDGNPVSDAGVAMDLHRDGTLYATASGSVTDGSGTVSYSFHNAPSGIYTTIVTAVTHAELEFVEGTPELEFEKQ